MSRSRRPPRDPEAPGSTLPAIPSRNEVVRFMEGYNASNPGEQYKLGNLIPPPTEVQGDGFGANITLSGPPEAPRRPTNVMDTLLGSRGDDREAVMSALGNILNFQEMTNAGIDPGLQRQQRELLAANQDRLRWVPENTVDIYQRIDPSPINARNLMDLAFWSARKPAVNPIAEPTPYPIPIPQNNPILFPIPQQPQPLPPQQPLPAGPAGSSSTGGNTRIVVGGSQAEAEHRPTSQRPQPVPTPPRYPGNNSQEVVIEPPKSQRPMPPVSQRPQPPTSTSQTQNNYNMNPSSGNRYPGGPSYPQMPSSQSPGTQAPFPPGGPYGVPGMPSTSPGYPVPPGQTPNAGPYDPSNQAPTQGVGEYGEWEPVDPGQKIPDAVPVPPTEGEPNPSPVPQDKFPNVPTPEGYPVPVVIDAPEEDWEEEKKYEQNDEQVSQDVASGTEEMVDGDVPWWLKQGIEFALGQRYVDWFLMDEIAEGTLETGEYRKPTGLMLGRFNIDTVGDIGGRPGDGVSRKEMDEWYAQQSKYFMQMWADRVRIDQAIRELGLEDQREQIARKYREYLSDLAYRFPEGPVLMPPVDLNLIIPNANARLNRKAAERIRSERLDQEIELNKVRKRLRKRKQQSG